MKSRYIWAIGVGLVVGLIAGCKENNPKQPVTMAPTPAPTTADRYPEPPPSTLAPTPTATPSDTYSPPVDTTPIPPEERPAPRTGGTRTAKATPAPHRDYAPASPKSGQNYTVKKGDTLQEISQKFYGTTKKWRKIYEA